MAHQSVFTRIDPDLTGILEDLRAREPIFHTERFGRTIAEFEHGTDSDFWEVGASGRRYSREFILDLYRDGELPHPDNARWKTTEFGLRRLGPDCFLLTYTLDQDGRVTRRATIWRQHAGAWRVLYHQGTLATSLQDDTLPEPNC